MMRNALNLVQKILYGLVLLSGVFYVFNMSQLQRKQQERWFGELQPMQNRKMQSNGSLKIEVETEPFETDDFEVTPNVRFEKLLAKYAKNNVIILAVTDFGYIEMAENLYESSFKRLNIDNYLFVCSHPMAEEYLTSRNIHAISLWNDSLSTKESLYNGEGYRNKTNFKTDSVFMSLSLGYTTLLVDVDIVFLQNPLPYLMKFSENYDLIIQNGYRSLNSGKFISRFHSQKFLCFNLMKSSMKKTMLKAWRVYPMDLDRNGSCPRWAEPSQVFQSKSGKHCVILPMNCNSGTIQSLIAEIVPRI